jgi:hypothetical protein
VTKASDDGAAYSLNTRPRQTLGGMTPSDKLTEAMQWPLEITPDMGGLQRQHGWVGWWIIAVSRSNVCPDASV